MAADDNTGTTATTNNKYADWAKLALEAYAAYNASKPGEFKQAPESPQMIALRQKMLGYIDNSPTRNMLGGILAPKLEASAQDNFQLPQGANGYNPNNTGPKPQYDMKAIFGSIASPSNPYPGVPAGATDPSIPPPPPEVNTQGFDRTRKKNVLKKALGGLAGGFIGGGGGATGAVTGLWGEYQGGKAANDEAQAKWDAAYKPFNDWKTQWGSAFGDHIPQNMAEYQQWYQQKYGRPYTVTSHV
jgi:hypothetical protein